MTILFSMAPIKIESEVEATQNVKNMISDAVFDGHKICKQNNGEKMSETNVKQEYLTDGEGMNEDFPNSGQLLYEGHSISKGTNYRSDMDLFTIIKDEIEIKEEAIEIEHSVSSDSASVSCVHADSVKKEQSNKSEEVYIKPEHISNADNSGDEYLDNSLKRQTSKTEKQWKCKDCDKTFVHACRLKVHMRVHAAHKCTSCDKSFIRGSQLRKHMLTHTGKKEHDCPQCEKSFKTAANLQAHSRIHSGDKPFSCRECQKTFNHPSNLRVHLTTHTGLKPFTCLHCGKMFRQAYYLKIHERLHTAESLCVCGQCGKVFIREAELTVHARIHTGQRPYACSQCDKTYTQISHLNVHVKIVHDGHKPYSCTICDHTFSYKPRFKIHMKTHSK